MGLFDFLKRGKTQEASPPPIVSPPTTQRPQLNVTEAVIASTRGDIVAKQMYQDAAKNVQIGNMIGVSRVLEEQKDTRHETAIKKIVIHELAAEFGRATQTLGVAEARLEELVNLGVDLRSAGGAGGTNLCEEVKRLSPSSNHPHITFIEGVCSEKFRTGPALAPEQQWKNRSALKAEHAESVRASDIQTRRKKSQIKCDL